MKRTRILELVILLSILGALTSTYLVYSHYQTKANGICDISSVFSCSFVNQSSYATFLGIPVAFFGVAWFLITIALTLKVAKEKKWLKPIVPWQIIGLLSVAYFIWAEIQLQAICLFCSAVHLIIIVIALLFWYYKYQLKTIIVA